MIAEGTANELKTKAGGDVLEVTVASPRKLTTAAKALSELASGEAQIDRRTNHVTVPVFDGSSALVEAVRRLDKARVKIDDLSLHRPSLDDVFFGLTGRAAEQDTDAEADEPSPDGQRRRGRSRA